MYYKDVFKKLDDDGIRYLVVGGVALVLHGIVRLTADLDLMVSLDNQNLMKFITAMNEIGYKPKMPVKPEDFLDVAKRQLWKKEKGMQVFSFYNPSKPMELVDVFIDEPIDFCKAEKRRVVMKVKEIQIPVVSIEDLVELKKLSGRPQDIADIDALNELKKLIKNKGADE